MTPSTVRAWFWIHLVSLGAVILQPSTPATYLGRYSKTSLIILIVMVVLTPFIWLGTTRLAKRLEAKALTFDTGISLFVLILSTLAILALWMVNVGPTNSYTVIRLALTFVTGSIALTAIQGLDRTILAKVTPYAGWIMGLGLCIVCLVLATRFPSLLWTDEGYNTSIGLSFARYGQLVPLSFFGGANYGSLYSATYMGLGEVYRLFGVSLSIGRLYTFLIGLLGTFFIYRTARCFYSRPAAWAGVILTIPVILKNNFLRADIEVFLFLSLALYAFALAQRQKRIGYHLLAGIALGFSLDGHPIAYRLIIAAGLAYLAAYGPQYLKQRRFQVIRPVVVWTLGVLVGIGIYIGLYSILLPEGFYSQIQSSTRNLSAFSRTPELLFDQFDSALQNSPLLLGAAIIGIVVALRRRTEFDRLLLIMIFTSPLIFALTYAVYRNYYLFHIVPLLALLAIGIFPPLTQTENTEQNEQRQAFVATGLAFILFVACCGLLVQQIRGADAQSYDQALQVADRLRPLVPSNMRFVGIDPFYLHMSDYDHFMEINLGSIYGAEKSLDESAVWEKFKPDAVVLVTGYPIPASAALVDYTQQQLVPIHCWNTSKLGKVTLYMRAGLSTEIFSDQCEVLN